MIILVDGIDRVGKTTLCRMLTDEFGIPSNKDDTRYLGTHRDVIVNTEKINTFMNLIENRCITNIIFDRFHLTEYVYSAIERGFINKNMFDIDKRLCDCGELVILIYVRPTDIVKSSVEHGKDLSEHDALFATFFNLSKLKYKIKTSYNYFDDVIKEVKRIRSEYNENK